jgi:glucose/arabinose dehydrogenase
MTHSFLRTALLIAFTSSMITSCSDNKEKKTEPVTITDTDLVFPTGFSATSIVNELGDNRHIFVNTNGDVYVKLSKLRDGNGIVVLRDTAKDGKYVIVKSFGNFIGTGIFIKNGYLYASSNEEVFRYKMNEANEVADPDNPEKIVTGLVQEGQHESKSIALDDAGNLYITIGAPANACQEKDRTAGSPGKDPCPLLEKTGGVWQFKADKLNQSYAEGVHYATGIRNMVGVNWNSNQNQLYGVQHGRDQFAAFYPTMYTEEQSAELPSEEFFLIKKGSDFGWPYCYYDHLQKKKILGPEYGGDGKQTGRCEGKDLPIMGFPGHWAPNDLLFYTGNLFPEKYHNGAFIAFHGSWNRAPFKQAGYSVVFVPFKNGTPSGDYEIFANGFIGKDSITGPNDAKYRPCGLAQGPDGSLYISESTVGKIWKVGYKQ